jgi:hypothetical protein
MRRREFIALMGASVTWPFAALAQAVGKNALRPPRRAASLPETEAARTSQK